MRTYEQDGETFTPEYYLCGRMPVVAYVDPKGGWRDAKVPGKDAGQLEFSNSHMSYIQFSDNADITKITEEEFDQRCQDFGAKIERGKGSKL